MDVPFKDMDEVRDFAAKMKTQLDAEDYECLLFLLGLLENRGISTTVEIKGKSVKIDRFIAPFIAECNQRGLNTLACCSGLDEEHADTEYKPVKGYISFVFDIRLYSYLKDNLDDSYAVVQSESYLSPSVYVEISGENDLEKKRKWKNLFVLMESFYDIWGNKKSHC